MGHVELSKIAPYEYDEHVVLFDGRPLIELPRFKDTAFSSNFVFSDDRVLINILLTALGSLKININRIERKNSTLVISTANHDFSVAVHQVMTEDLWKTLQIQDFSAGLAQWASSDERIASKLEGLQLTIVLPDFSAESELQTAWVEAKEFIVNDSLRETEPGRFVTIPSKYPTLQRLNVRYVVRKGSVRFLQVTQGAKSVAGPEHSNSRLAFTIEQYLERARMREHAADWLLIWFQEIYGQFTVSGAKDAISDIDIRPYKKLLVGDGRELAVRTD